MTQSDRLGIDFISVLGMPPVEFAKLAASFGVSQISTGLKPITDNPCNYPAWSLRDDAALRNDFRAALSDTGVMLANGEGIFVTKRREVREFAGDMDLFAELGCKRINTLCLDNDVDYCVEQLGIFADMAGERGMSATLEYMAGMAVGSMASALDAIRATGRSNLTLMLDCLHFARSGSIPSEISTCDPAMIGYFQLCDAPDKPIDAEYGEDARHNRLRPGEGKLPLAQILAEIPRNIPVGLELPMLPRAKAGETPPQYLAPAIEKARAMLAAVEN